MTSASGTWKSKSLDLPHHPIGGADEVAVEREGQVAEGDHDANCVPDQLDEEVVGLRDAELARRNDLLPAPAVVREEHEDREAVVYHPERALEEVELELVDVADLYVCSSFFSNSLTHLWQTLRGPFLAVSTPVFASKYSFESS